MQNLTPKNTPKTIKTLKLTMPLNARRSGRIALFAALLVLASCITVNVNFPESAVQRAADDFVRELYKGPTVADNSKPDANAEAAVVKDDVKKSLKKSKAPASQVPAKPATGDQPTSWIFNFGITSAFAQELNMTTPRAMELRARMKSRIPDIRKWKIAGAICETPEADLVFKYPQKAGGEAGNVARLVKTENDDRDALYVEITDANKMNDRKQSKIRKIFASKFKEYSPAETCFEQ